LGRLAELPDATSFCLAVQMLGHLQRVTGESGSLPVMRGVHSSNMVPKGSLGFIPLADLFLMPFERFSPLPIALFSFSRPQLTLQSCPIAPAFVALFPAQSQTTISY
jgi:hypothetical protein